MTPLLLQFLAESRDLLDGIGAQLLRLERQPDDAAVVNELFRLVHTLKGNSGLFEFPDMTRVLHAAEDLLVAVRDGRIGYSRALADQLLEATDFVLTLCDGIERNGQVEASFAPSGAALAAGLRALIPSSSAPLAAEGVSAPSVAMGYVPPYAMLDADTRAQVTAALRGGASLRWLRYVPDEQCFFQGDDPFFTARQTPALLWGRPLPRESWPALDALDPYRCVLEFHLLSSAPQAELDEHFRYVPDQISHVPFDTVSFETATAVPPPSDQAMIDTVLAAQAEILALDDEPTWMAGRLRAVSASLAGCCLARGDGAALPALETATAAAIAAGNGGPLRAWLDAYSQAASRTANGTAAAAAASDAAPKFGRRSEDAIGSRTLKIDAEKIDRLMNLIGEFVVSKNSLPYLARRAEQHYGLRELSREIKDKYAVLERIAEEMQDAIMQVRMTPFSFVSMRFPRLVRDIAHRLGKEVELVVEGEDTEADKNIIEALADPLIHILRNSLDHGLELPADRLAAGKPACGTLRIHAMQEADRFIVDVSDDGKGIDPDAIRRSAVTKGLYDEAAVQRLSDREAIHLVFMPGFSTAAAVSDLSGRGVGMDAVRTAVEKLGGTLELDSTKGRGTALRLALPLSMAVTQVMIVEADKQLFGVPTNQVVETVRVPRDAVQSIKRREATVLRDRVVPMRPLHEMLGLDAAPVANADDEVAMLVARVGANEVGVVVDEFRGCQDIIQKPMSGVLAGLSSYTGSALLGDGSVLMVLNLAELV